MGFIATRTYRCLPKIYSCEDSRMLYCPRRSISWAGSGMSLGLWDIHYWDNSGTYSVMPSDVVRKPARTTRSTRDESSSHGNGAFESSSEFETLQSSTLALIQRHRRFVAH